MDGRHEDINDNTGDAFVTATDMTLSHEPGSIGAVLAKLNAFTTELALLKPAQKIFVEKRLKELLPTLILTEEKSPDPMVMFQSAEVDKFAGLLYMLGSIKESKRFAYLKTMNSHVDELSKLLLSSDQPGWHVVDRLIALLKLFPTNELDRLSVLDLVHDLKREVSLNKIIHDCADLMNLLACFSVKNRPIILEKVKDSIEKWITTRELFEVLLTYVDDNTASKYRLEFKHFPSITSLALLCDTLSFLKPFQRENHFDYAEMILAMLDKNQLNVIVNSGYALSELQHCQVPYTLVLSYLDKPLSAVLQDLEDACCFFDIIVDESILRDVVMTLKDWLPDKFAAANNLTTAEKLGKLRVAIYDEVVFRETIQLLAFTLTESIKTRAELIDCLISIGKENHIVLLSVASSKLPSYIQVRADFDSLYQLLDDNARAHLVQFLKGSLEVIVADPIYHAKLIRFFELEPTTTDELRMTSSQQQANAQAAPRGWLTWIWRPKANVERPVAAAQSSIVLPMKNH